MVKEKCEESDREWEERQKTRQEEILAVSDALNDYEMALNSPAPVDWEKELQTVDALRMKAIREIEALVGEECEILLPTMVFGFKYVGKSQGTVKLHNTGPGEYIRTLSTELLLTLVSELQKVIK